MMEMKLDLPEKLFGFDTSLVVIFVWPAVMIMITLILVNLLVMPRVSDFQAAQNQIGVVSRKVTDLKQKVSYLRSLDQDNLQKNETLVNNAIIPEKNSYYLVTVIKKVADNYNFRVDAFSVRPGEISGQNATKVVSRMGYDVIPVTLTLVGPSSSYFDLVDGLEKTLPILALRSFTMKSQDSVATIDMEVNGFYVSEQKLVASDTLSLSDLTLKDSETSLIARLSNFKVPQNISEMEGVFNTKGQFVKYNRLDPFTQ